MEISISIEQGKEPIAIMKLKGGIDATNFMEVVDKAQEIYKNPARDLIIDLSEVPSISSTGQVAIHKIALIYSGVPQRVEVDENPDFTHSSQARKHVKLLSPQPAVDETLTKAGLKLFFNVFSDLESALKSF
ncbi:MAG TPA: STAS domain-containing protein [Anaerolineales bacterium]|nr:STAS domain-containing protein [Anaerolineales bacterium]